MKKALLRDEFLAGVFFFFFIIAFLADKLVYNIPNNLALLHGILSGMASIAIMLAIRKASKMGIL